ncbi:hypothetical protein D3C80_1415090 [compost metagenome]
MMQRLDAMHQNAATDQKHRRRADHRQAFHHVRCGPQDAVTNGLGQARCLLGHPQPQVIELDDAGHQPVNADGHDDGDARQHDDLLAQRRIGHGTQGDGDDFR